MTPDADFVMDFARRGARAGRGGRGQRQFGNLEDTSRRLWSHVGNGRQGHVGNKIGLYIGRGGVSIDGDCVSLGALYMGSRISYHLVLYR